MAKSQPRIAKPNTAPQPGVRSEALAPDEWLRQVLQQQARGAFDPLTDDRRVRALQTRLRLNPQDTSATVELATVYERYRLYEEAFDLYLQAWNLVDQRREAAEGADRQLAERAAVGLGRCAGAAGRSAEAVPVLAAFVQRWPSVDVWNALGILYDEVGERPAAEAAFHQALALEPDSGRLHNNLGYNLLLQNKLEAAGAEFRRALELKPASATARNNLGAVLARGGDLEGARQQFRLAAADDSAAHNNLAVVLLEMGDYERSRGELVQALSARLYFAPALENFKRVQQLLRQRAEPPLPSAGSLSQNAPPLPSPAAPGVEPSAEKVEPVEQDHPPSRQEGGAASESPKDRP